MKVWRIAVILPFAAWLAGCPSVWHRESDGRRVQATREEREIETPSILAVFKAGQQSGPNAITYGIAELEFLSPTEADAWVVPSQTESASLAAHAPAGAAVDGIQATPRSVHFVKENGVWVAWNPQEYAAYRAFTAAHSNGRSLSSPRPASEPPDQTAR